MHYAIVTDPDRPHYGECGPVEQCNCLFWWIPWGPAHIDGEAYFLEEIHCFSVNSPSITFSSPDFATTVN